MYSDRTQRKIQLYYAANYLFEQGKSHPRVINILSKYESDIGLLTEMADQAMEDKWRKIFNETQRLFSEGKTYGEVVDKVSHMETDEEILHFICNSWYRVKTLYIDHLIDAPTNITEGIEGVAFCSIGVCAVFYFDAFLLSKIAWVVGLLASLVTWLYGLQQKRSINGLRKIIEEDYDQLANLR